MQGNGGKGKLCKSTYSQTLWKWMALFQHFATFCRKKRPQFSVNLLCRFLLVWPFDWLSFWIKADIVRTKLVLSSLNQICPMHIKYILVRHFWPLCSPTFPSSAFIYWLELRPTILPNTRPWTPSHTCLPCSCRVGVWRPRSVFHTSPQAPCR